MTRRAHLEELVGRLLILLGHGGRRGFGESAEATEDGEASQDTTDSVQKDVTALVGGRKGAGAMRAEGKEIGCIGSIKLVKWR
jgi:hypothetical protein